MGARDPVRDGVGHALVREHFAAFAEHVQAGGRSLPRYAVAEFEAFVRCGGGSGSSTRASKVQGGTTSPALPRWLPSRGWPSRQKG